MRYLYLFTLFSYITLAEIPVEGKFQSLLPEPLNQYKIKSTTLSQIEEQLGKAHLVEGSDYYWEREKLKYALKLSFDNKLLTTIHYTFPSNRPKLLKLEELDLNKLRPSLVQKNYSVLREKNSEVTIEPVTKTIYSIKIW